MPRAAHGPASRRKRNRIFKRAKGFVGGRGKLLRTAKETVKRAMYFSYRDRKTKKRAFRGLWIIRLNAACRENGISYSKFISGLKKAKVNLDRKQLADVAVKDDASFKKLVELAKKSA
ncbi:MAG: 50S ribosomal protein L20 [Candidatus Omnitrophica bacterium]|nr:50S ribosomal protein L20 [Candidatus Omnitrophota bacterium]